MLVFYDVIHSNVNPRRRKMFYEQLLKDTCSEKALVDDISSDIYFKEYLSCLGRGRKKRG